MSCKNQTKEIASREKITELPYFNSADFTPEWNTPKHKIPEFSFINQNGKEVNNKTFKGKIYIADFFFTSCPGICPKLTKNMRAIQEAYKNQDNIMLLSHTVMPWRDSIPLLKQYAEKYHVNSEKWHLVTGDKDALYDIARNGYFADEDFTKTQDESNFIHTENFILIDKEGYIRGVYNGTLPVDVERLKRHVKILMKEI
jgi:protein SCO1/2